MENTVRVGIKKKSNTTKEDGGNQKAFLKCYYVLMFHSQSAYTVEVSSIIIPLKG